jgi:glutathione synthase/RimK-type ligase-like ATP-grasp enzyme
MILILSHPGDVHAQAVMRALARKSAPHRLLDLSHYPKQQCSTWHFKKRERIFRLETSDGPLDLGQCRVIWWRRPQPFDIHEELDDPELQQFAHAEMYEAFAGMWNALDAVWMNPPRNDEVAHRKVYQLRVAQDVGLTVPETLITSDPEAARAFIARRGAGRTIYKAFSATERLWRETRLVKPEELTLIDNVAYAPVIFQEYVPAEVDLRITVVGDEIFAAEIHSQRTRYRVDMRMDINNALIAPVKLPAELEDGLHRLMAKLGLVYGAIDMRRSPDGAHIFLEINPAGQWLFIEEKTGQPISEAIAAWMLARSD